MLNNLIFSQCQNKISKLLENCVYSINNKPVNNFKYLFKKNIDSLKIKVYQNIINEKIDSIDRISNYKIYKYDEIDFEVKFEAKRIITPNYNKVYIVKYLNKSGEISYWYFSLANNRIVGMYIVLKGKRPIAWI